VFTKILSFDWAFLLFWMVATSLGWVVGSFFSTGLPLFAVGAAIGAFQWLVLQGRIARAWRWLLATTLGWVAGALLAFYTVPTGLEAMNGVVVGLAAGLAQWLMLRGEVRWAGWWIPFSIMGWVTGLTLLPGFLLTGTLAGAITGLAMEVLLRNRKKKGNE
jgi:hypothetical protein